MSGVFQCKSAKVAVWTGGTDDAPFNAPRTYIQRVKFHSDFDYPKIIQTRSVSVSLPTIAANGVRENTYNLFSHGRPGYPWVLGSITLGGVKIPMAGHVPVQFTNSTFQFGTPAQVWGRWVALGADDTFVVLHEYGRAAFNQAAVAKTISFTVYVTDELL